VLLQTLTPARIRRQVASGHNPLIYNELSDFQKIPIPMSACRAAAAQMRAPSTRVSSRCSPSILEDTTSDTPKDFGRRRAAVSRKNSWEIGDARSPGPDSSSSCEREGEAISRSFESFSMRFCILVAVLAVASACSPRSAAVSGVYARDTRELIRIDYDYNGDGDIDVRTYMRNGRPIRLEGDTNGDDLIDRWEYYDEAGRLLRVGGSTQADGREDSWAYLHGDDVRVEISTRRDGRVDRREFFRKDMLLRTESDTNNDGLVDTWEQYENGALAVLMVDDWQQTGRPTRRIVYSSGGDTRVEIDPDGDGMFEAVARKASAIKEGPNASR
jgi:hypothetical protein